MYYYIEARTKLLPLLVEYIHFAASALTLPPFFPLNENRALHKAGKRFPDPFNRRLLPPIGKSLPEIIEHNN
jgi:hypothetical protein